MDQGSPFRSAPIREACTACRQPATTRCERCGAPLCHVHAPARFRRCADCETDFEWRTRRPIVLLLPLGIWLVALSALVAVVAADFIRQDVPFGAWLSLVSLALFSTPFVGVASRAIYVLFARQRFLARRAANRRLPVDYSEESWFEVGESWSRIG